jgi:putative sporulation protein YyaC
LLLFFYCKITNLRHAYCIDNIIVIITYGFLYTFKKAVLQGGLSLTDLYSLQQETDLEDSIKSLRTFYYDEDSVFMISNFLKNNIDGKYLLLCIGSDRYIGDCLGPLVGTALEKMKLECPIIGTLENPVHAINLRKQLSYIESTYPKHKIIALDACLGAEENIGCIQLKADCLYPGKGVGKKLPAVGDLSIVGIVDSCENEEFLFLHNVRLNLIMKMSEVIAKGIYEGLK